MTHLALKECEDDMREIVSRGVAEIERAHSDADAVLVRALRLLGYGTLCDLWDDVEKWYA